MVRIVDRRIGRRSLPVSDEGLEWDAGFERRLRSLVREEIDDEQRSLHDSERRRQASREQEDDRSVWGAGRRSSGRGTGGASLQQLLEELLRANARREGDDDQGGHQYMNQQLGQQQGQQGGQQSTTGPQQGISHEQIEQLIAQLREVQGNQGQQPSGQAFGGGNQSQSQNGPIQGSDGSGGQGTSGNGASVHEMLQNVLEELKRPDQTGQTGQQSNAGQDGQSGQQRMVYPQQGQQGQDQQGQQGSQQQQVSFQDQLRNALQQLVGGPQGQQQGGGQQQQSGGQQQQSGGQQGSSQQQGVQSYMSLPPQQLAQAHGQVSEELANNLRKLKQVIAETQQIAYKMEMILAQEEKRSGKAGGGR